MRMATLMTILAAPLALAACGSDPEAAHTDDLPMSEKMSMADSGNEMQTASAEGTVTAVDNEAGTITIDHAPVPSVNWPAMTMAFDAGDELRNEVSVGDAISFEFETGPDGNLVKSITKK